MVVSKLHICYTAICTVQTCCYNVQRITHTVTQHVSDDMPAVTRMEQNRLPSRTSHRWMNSARQPCTAQRQNNTSEHRTYYRIEAVAQANRGDNLYTEGR